MDPKICYVWDEILIERSVCLPAVIGRASLVHDLLEAYNLHTKAQVVRSTPASYEELRLFHSELYLEHLKSYTEFEDDYLPDKEDEEFGLGYDCPPVSNMYSLVSTLAGGSITAAKCLTLGITNVAINWCGGWHHAQRHAAEGFCYVNDIVLAIETLRKKFTRVLYIDLDVHHGNGVQNAYNLSKSVFTLSFHKYEPGFYPGSGSLDDIGSLAGKGYSCNVPLSSGYSNDTLEYIFLKVFPLVYDAFQPMAVVIQCGADALAHDTHGGACLTIRGYITCVRTVLDTKKPTVLLGGGGYNHANAARLWTSITALATGSILDDNIPEHDHFPSYSPSYTIDIEPSLLKDCNNKASLDKCFEVIKDNITKYLKDDNSKRVEDNRQTSAPVTGRSSRTNFNSIQVDSDKVNKPIQVNSDQINKPDIYEFSE